MLNEQIQLQHLKPKERVIEALARANRSQSFVLKAKYAWSQLILEVQYRLFTKPMAQKIKHLERCLNIAHLTQRDLEHKIEQLEFHIKFELTKQDHILTEAK